MVKEILIASHAGILWNEDDPRFAQLGIILHPKDDAFKTESTSPISASEPGPSNGNGSQTIDIESSPPSHDITTPVDYVGSDDAEIDRCEPDDAPSPHLPVDAREEDVLAPIHDPLETVPAWWIIEFLPFVSAKQVPNDIWTNRARCAHVVLSVCLSERARIDTIGTLGSTSFEVERSLYPHRPHSPPTRASPPISEEPRSVPHQHSGTYLSYNVCEPRLKSYEPLLSLLGRKKVHFGDGTRVKLKVKTIGSRIFLELNWKVVVSPFSYGSVV